MSEYVEITMMPLGLSDKAVKCDCGLEEDVWLPLSQFETPPHDADIGKVQIFEIKEWLARDKGLI